ncbi:glucose-methanol-choline oxidoreductase [Acephala macrosclerotiorum]|nr:glucose-methanol-choline oxidoreductase [Acephala macrosclerotiorum]
MAPAADFIIVGGGTSALLLASKLAAAVSRPKILVIEAGSDYQARSDALRKPSDRFSLAYTNPELDHGYSTIPQRGLNDRILPYIRGKGLGGSSLMNFMAYLSGCKQDYDFWAELVGDDSWGWEHAHKRLREIENFNGAVPEGFDAVASPSFEEHGHEGPVGVSLPKVWESGAKELILEAPKLGIPINKDLNSGNLLGLGMSPICAQDGLRTTSASAFLKTIPENLEIWTDTLVAKVLFEGKRAVGVQLLDGRTVTAKHEVILSAGSVDTPKLLMLSGVGPRATLAEHQIPVVAELEGVGKGLVDHPAIFLCASMKPGYAIGERMAFSRSSAPDKTGELDKQNQSLAVMFNKISRLYSTPEFLALPAQEQAFLKRDGVPTYEAAFGGPLVPPEAEKEIPDGYEYLSIVVFAMNPRSKGSVSISSNKAEDKPVLDLGAYTDASGFDVKVMKESIRDVVHFFESTEMYKNGFDKWLGGPGDLGDEKGLEALVREMSITVWHACGTCKMGRVGEEGTCVGSDFKVRGVEGLRVVDMSVAPVLVSGHTQATAYLIGMMAAEKLMEEYGL